MTIDNDMVYSLNHMCPVAAKVAMGDGILAMQTELLRLAAVDATTTAVIHATHTITLANCQAAVGGVKTLARTTVLPANARLVQALYTLTYFDNAGDTGVESIVAGGTTANGILNLTDVSTGGAGVAATKIAATGAQVIPWLSLSGQTITSTLTSSVDLNTLTKGGYELDIFYVVLA